MKRVFSTTSIFWFCSFMYKFDINFDLHSDSVYLLYTILYSSVYSVSSNFINNLMIASSKIAVFPDPVGADTTIDTSVRNKINFLLPICWGHRKKSYGFNSLYISLNLLHFCCLAYFPIYPSSHLAVLPTWILVLITLMKAKCFGLADRLEKPGGKCNSVKKQGSQDSLSSPPFMKCLSVNSG